MAGWACITCPLTGGRLMILLRHLSLILKIYKIRDQRILVREFSNLPLLLVFPLLWPLRKRIHFLINHNLQWAARDPLERFGLSMLARLGARWALFETQDFPNLGKFKIPSSENLILPHPVLNVGQTSLSARKNRGVSTIISLFKTRNDEIIGLTSRALKSPPAEGCPKGGVGAANSQSPPAEGCPKGGVGSPVVGVAGYYRAEKGIDELISMLREELPMAGILLGVPNPEAAAHLDVEKVSTASAEDYFQMISRCDVLVFNGEQNSYFYRASGPVADAAACGTAVVVPDFPMLGKQAAGIGEVFQCLETGSAGYSLPGAVQRAVENARAGKYDFEAYCQARSVEALAERLRSV